MQILGLIPQLNDEPILIFSGQAMQRLREAKKLSRAQVAVQIPISEQAVYLWERGRLTPRVEHLVRCAHALGCHPGDLFDKADNDNAVRQPA